MERLHMHQIRDVLYRVRQGQSDRQIARDLGVSRLTVKKYRTLGEREGYLAGSCGLPTNAELAATVGPVPPPPRPVSTVAPYRAVVEKLLADGVELTAILARLREDHGYTGSYSSLRRFIQQIRPVTPEVHLRVETGPGEEAQVDFGSVGQLVDPRTNLARLAYVFVMTLCFSRHQYAELVFDQKIATWIGCHRRAFESFGGVPHRIVPDNLKAAVVVASFDDPVLGEGYRRLAQHSGFLISPTRPRTPEHKGKVESGVHYVQRNFMAGQQFADAEVANERLAIWVREIAGTRHHGTTGQAPLALFHAKEQTALLPLPVAPFDLLEVRPVKVHQDCHVQIAGSFYSVPWGLVGQKLDAFIGERVVELYQGADLVSTHLRAHGPGVWHTRLEHYPADKAAYLERTPQRCREIAQRLGPATSQVVETLLRERPLDRLRAVQGILRLEETVGPRRVEAACARALHFGDVRYRRIKDILNAALDQEPIPASSGTPRVNGERAYAFARPVADFFDRAEVAG
jgi:transposase